MYPQPEAYLLEHEGMTLAILKVSKNESGYLSENKVTVLYTYGKGGKDPTVALMTNLTFTVRCTS